MADSEIIVFPNHRVEIGSPNWELDASGEDVWLVRSLRDFLSEIEQAGGVPALAAATLPYSKDSRNNTNISGIDRFQFFPLGGAYIRHRGWWVKTMGYMVATYQLLFQIPKKPFWYLQYPGPIGILACLVGCLFHVRYGLYVRCRWKSSGWLGLLNRYYFKKADFIIATGEAFKMSLLEYNANVHEVAPMISFSLGDVCEKKSYAIHNEAVILFVGQLHPEKGILELVRAVSKVRKSCKIRLVLVGDSSGIPGMPGKLEETIEENHCQQQVEIVGQIRDKIELARRFEEADLFALPSYYPEGFPRVIYEAMSFGLPVICTDVEGREGFLRDGENCRYVIKESDQDLAKKLLELLEDKKLRSHIGMNGSRDVRKLLARYEGITHGMQVVHSVQQYFCT